MQHDLKAFDLNDGIDVIIKTWQISKGSNFY